MALATDNSDIYRTASAFEASKESRLVKPEEADLVRERGRAVFYNQLMGRYGLPGSAATSLEQPVAETSAGGRYDLTDMTVTDVLSLAQELTGGTSVGFPGASSSSNATSLVTEYEAHLEHLIEEDADPGAIDGARNVLEQARLMQAEQALYRSLDAARDNQEEGDGFGFGSLGLGGFLGSGLGAGGGNGLGPFGAPADLLSLPPAAITMMMTDQV